jgi:hypothetical protein
MSAFGGKADIRNGLAINLYAMPFGDMSAFDPKRTSEFCLRVGHR